MKQVYSLIFLCLLWGNPLLFAQIDTTYFESDKDTLAFEDSLFVDTTRSIIAPYSVPTYINIDTSKDIGQIPILSGTTIKGAKTYEIPINAAPGMNGFQPAISLLYNSQQGNSLAGMGWSISGLSQISRCCKTKYYDGISEGVKLDNTDPFILDGMRLIKKSTYSGYNLYESEVGKIMAKGYISGTVIKFFEVFYPNGTKGVFGYTSNTENKLFYPLTSLTDLYNNTITYNYDYSGSHYSISTISYNGATIEFDYENSRPDSIVMYYAGQEISETKRLHQITCKVNSSEIGIYTLSYIMSFSGKSLLKQVGFRSNGCELNPLQFYYNTNEPSPQSFTQQTISLYPYNTWALNPKEVRSYRGRLNYHSGADGLMTVPNLNPYYEHFSTDNKRFVNNYQGSESIYIYDGLDETTPELTASVPTEMGFVDLFCADLDGHLGQDIVKINERLSNNQDSVYFSVYRAELPSTLYKRYTSKFHIPTFYNDGHGHKSSIPKFYFTGDFTGNGKSEILAVSAHQPFNEPALLSNCYIFDLESNQLLYSDYIFPYHKQFIGNVISDATVAENNSDKIFTFDFDGDGKTDIGYVGTTEFKVYTFDITGNVLSPRLISTSSGLTRSFLANKQMLLGDVNGDGLTDILVSPSSEQNGTTWSKLLSKGDGTFESTTFNGFSYGAMTGEHFVVQDINNDGFCDLIKCFQSSLQVMLSNGKGFNNNVITKSMPENYMTIIPANINSNDHLTQIVGLKKNHVTKLSFNRTNEYESLIVGMANSFGVIEKNTYRLLTDDDGVYTYNPAGSNVTYPYVSLFERIPLVALSEKFVNRGLTGSDTYFYENAIIHRQGLGFRGFEKVTTANLRGQQTVQTFDQTRYGIITSSRTPAAENSYNYTVNVEGNKLVQIKLTGVQTNDLVKNIWKYSSYVYDNYNNPTTEYTFYTDGTTVSTSRSYNNYSNITDGYQLGCLYQQIATTYYNGDTYSEKYYVPAFNTKHRPIVEVRCKDGNQIWERINGYDSYGNITSESVKHYVASNRLQTAYSYDTHGRLSSTTTPTGEVTQYEYDIKGRMVRMTDHRGGVTNYTYDSFGKEIGANFPDGTSGTSVYAWNTAAPEGLFAVTRTRTGQPTTITHYDALGREVRHSDMRFDGVYRHIDKRYDEYGNLVSESFPYRGNLPSAYRGWGYDEFGRLVEDIRMPGIEDVYVYDGLTVTKYDNNNVESTHTYDVLGNLVSVTDNGGTITYNLAADGLPNSITAPGNITTSFTYDQYHRRTSITDPSSGTTTFTYNDAGNIASETDANGNTTTYEYDQYNRLVTTVRPEFTTTRTYSGGELTGVSSTNGTSKQMTYDAHGRLSTWKETVDSVWLQKSYTYSNNQISSITYSSQSGLYIGECYTYANGHLTQVRMNGNSQMFKLLQENGLGQPTQVITKGLTRTYSYTPTGIPTGRSAASTQYTLQDESYNFDPSTSNLLSKTDNIRNLSDYFQYDSMNRLVMCNGASVQYDTKGNILSKFDIGSFLYDNTQKPYAVTGTNAVSGTISNNTQSISYYSFPRPKTISENPYTVTFAYDSELKKVKKVVKKNGIVTETRYSLGDCYDYVITSNNNNITKEEDLYFFGGYYNAPILLKCNNGSNNISENLLIRDYLGSVTCMADATHYWHSDYSYDAWGRLRNPSTHVVYSYNQLVSNSPSLRGYCSHEHLPQFGLINMNARLYDPVVGRFLSPDPYIQAPDYTQSFNRYSYCLNNPLKYVDEDGEYWWIFVGALAGGVANLGMKAWNGQIHSWGDGFAAFGIGAVSGAVSAIAGYGAFSWVAGAGATAGAGGFIAGYASGAASSISGAAILSVGNNQYFGDPRYTWKEYAWAGGIGGLVSGFGNGMIAVFQGNNFWTGEAVAAGRSPFALRNVPVKSSIQNVDVEGREVIQINRKPLQNHHFATDKNKVFTPQMEEIVNKYGLDLNGDWNIERLPHIGRHPNAYHQWVLRQMNAIDAMPNMNQSKFLYEFDIRVIQPVKSNPDMLYKSYWNHQFKP